MMKPEYMSCPFCGEIPGYVVRTDDKIVDEGYAACDNCGARGPMFSRWQDGRRIGLINAEDTAGRWEAGILTKVDPAPYLHMREEKWLYPLNKDMGSDVW